MTGVRIALIVGWVLVLAHAAAAETTPPARTYESPDAGDSHAMSPVMDDRIFWHALLDKFEGRIDGGDSAFQWDGEAWAGTDYDRLWLKSEGQVSGDGTVDHGRHELLYGRAISTYFDAQAGYRIDLDSGPTRHWGAIGIQGLAPLFFEVEATAYIGTSGRFAGRLEGSYDLLLTQRLILQPEVELNLYSKTDEGRGIGRGLSEMEAGLRLRYEITRKFAPYVGVVYSRSFGRTADLAREDGESIDDVLFVVGIRGWF